MKYGIQKTIPQYSDAKASLTLTPENEGERLQLQLITGELKRLGINHREFIESNNDVTLRIGIQDDAK